MGKSIILIKTDGVQKGKQDAAPQELDYERDILNAGMVDPKLKKCLVQLAFGEMFPHKEGKNLAFWQSVTPSSIYAINMATHELFSRQMAAREAGDPLPEITDDMVLTRLSRTSPMSPRDVVQRMNTPKEPAPNASMARRR